MVSFWVSCMCYIDKIDFFQSRSQCENARAIFFDNFLFMEMWNFLYTLSCISRGGGKTGEA